MFWNPIKSYKERQINEKLKKFYYDVPLVDHDSNLSSLMVNASAFDNVEGTDKDTLHSYIRIYETVFAPLRDSARHVLEIGIYSGAFLKVLADYFANAQIYGIDINLSNLRFGKNDPRINVYEMSGADMKSVKRLNVDYFDLIIEDGSHIPDEQVATFENYAPFVRRGGLYITEDINSKMLTSLSPRLKKIATDNQMYFEIIDLRFVKGRYDDICMIAIKK